MLRWKVDQTSDRVVTVAVDGNLDRHSTPPLARSLDHELPRVLTSTEEVVLDLSRVGDFDTHGLNLVLTVQRRVRYDGRKLSLVTGTDGVDWMLRHTGLAAQFNVDSNAATATPGSPVRPSRP